MEYRPQDRFDTPIMLLIPEATTVKGSTKKKYRDVGEILFCSFKTYGGTERQMNDTYVVEDTAVIETWFDPAITAECRIKLPETGELYEVIGKPEDINRRHQFVKFKVRAYEGGA